jgi:hypothetical protein
VGLHSWRFVSFRWDDCKVISRIEAKLFAQSKWSLASDQQIVKFSFDIFSIGFCTGFCIDKIIE